ncbi:site-2 protease family protein [Candidatus Micrarchaeota archaeon]|nr:site-2 protease family protein [Candidatus Micrarchaeota archaeon]
MKKLLAAFTTLISVFAFYEVVESPINGIAKFIISAVILFLSGMCLQKLLNLNGEKGIIILATERGKKSLDRLAAWNPGVWRSLADFGMVMGFGASSALLFKKISRRNLKVSLLVLMLSILFVLPFVLPVAVSIIELPISTSILRGSASANSAPESSSVLLYYIVFFSLLIGGFCIAGVMSFIGYGLFITYSIFMKLLSIFGVPAGNAEALTAITPGAAPIIPGINLPFFEGILALAVILFFHEVSHGILARVEKIKVKNSGLVLFGFIPIGAFVEPDEDQLQKSDPEKQKNVLVAGSSANLVLSIVFFLFFIGYLLVIIDSYPPPNSYIDQHVLISEVARGSPAYGILKPGMVVEQWNGVELHTLYDFYNASNMTKENDTVSIVTDSGYFLLKAGENGKVGVLTFSDAGLSGWIRELSYQPGKWWLAFLYNFIGLTFVLNFLVGTVNLLPIPPFDGYRIISLVVKGEKLIKAIAIAMIVFFAINLIPWIWYRG